ncbi:MAG: hypothetical protein ACR2GQ_07490 [Gemmatimonadota bacterium]
MLLSTPRHRYRTSRSRRFAAERRGERWWIVSVYRAQESADMPIPPEFLPADD